MIFFSGVSTRKITCILFLGITLGIALCFWALQYIPSNIDEETNSFSKDHDEVDRVSFRGMDVISLRQFYEMRTKKPFIWVSNMDKLVRNKTVTYNAENIQTNDLIEQIEAIFLLYGIRIEDRGAYSIALEYEDREDFSNSFMNKYGHAYFLFTLHLSGWFGLILFYPNSTRPCGQNV
ncbi:hypothetical protein MLD52_18345 [Puniceicoccaceae bacterium K14]|nr:hypothetical protein [Puniceicoccaceae bacterium K14]